MIIDEKHDKLIMDYLKEKVLYRELTLDLIYKTIYDLYKIINEPNIKIVFSPYFGSCADPKPYGERNAFDLLIIAKNENKQNKIYSVSIRPVPESTQVVTKEID